MDHESVQATALKIVFDLLHVYGFEAFNIVASSRASNERADETKDPCEGRDPSEAGGGGGTGEAGGGGGTDEAGEGGDPCEGREASDPCEAGGTSEGCEDGDPCEASEGSGTSEGCEDGGGDKANDTMQRLLNIMVSFLEGEVRKEVM